MASIVHPSCNLHVAPECFGVLNLLFQPAELTSGQVDINHLYEILSQEPGNEVKSTSNQQ